MLLWRPRQRISTKAAVAGRMALAKQILAVFSTDELRAEIARRDKTNEGDGDEQTYVDLAEHP